MPGKQVIILLANLHLYDSLANNIDYSYTRVFFVPPQLIDSNKLINTLLHVSRG